MISLREIEHNLLKIWNNKKFLRVYLENETIFPLHINLGKPTGKIMIENFNEIQEWIKKIKKNEKSYSGYGYSIEYSSINHRQLGKQEIPNKIRFDSERDFLKTINKEKDYEIFKYNNIETQNRLPGLKELIYKNPFILIKYDNDWTKLLSVCEFFINNPMPNIYIRQISIPGIHSKFIEKYKSIIREMLNTIDKGELSNNNYNNLKSHVFEQRFGLKYDEPLIRFRILDPKMYISNLSDLSISLSEFKILELYPKNVFITENKINGLVLENIPGSIVIFGLGYGVQSLKDVSWLKESNIFYWGDIDTHGFQILSMVKGFFPNCTSIFMDRETLIHFKDSCVMEDEDKRCLNDLDLLSVDEAELYDDLRNNHLGKNMRLEQEMISYSYIESIINNLDL